MFPLDAQSRCNAHMNIYDMIAEVELFGGRKEPRGMGEGVNMNKVSILILNKNMIINQLFCIPTKNINKKGTSRPTKSHILRSILICL